MRLEYYHADCGGQVSDTGLHSRGKSLWQCASCGFCGYPYKGPSIDDSSDKDSPVYIEADDVTACFVRLLDTRDRRVIIKFEDSY